MLAYHTHLQTIICVCLSNDSFTVAHEFASCIDGQKAVTIRASVPSLPFAVVAVVRCHSLSCAGIRYHAICNCWRSLSFAVVHFRLLSTNFVCCRSLCRSFVWVSHLYRHACIVHHAIAGIRYHSLSFTFVCCRSLCRSLCIVHACIVHCALCMHSIVAIG